ncbi:MAG: alpha/beta hydrolase [Verrucomicrobia bacterium]|nr:alpha/beta hydrolase [Verrucomicrobiota bacterium]
MPTQHSRILLALTLALTGCSQYASVSPQTPQFHPVRATLGTLATVEHGITSGLRREKHDPLVALGEFLTAADLAAKQLERHPADSAARDAYNFAVARVLGIIQKAKLDPWTQPLRVPAVGGEFLVTHRPDPRPAWNPALYDFTPADEFDISGSYVTEHSRKEGLGAPTVATGRGLNANAAKDFTIPKIFYGITALIRFEGRRAVIGFEDPLATERVSFGGHSVPLAADYTVPLAVMLASTQPKKMELTRLLRPEQYAETARISRLQPYDPNKTVVLVVHGLMDSPATWVPMINALRGDAQIRRTCQFWFYSYPSGYPYPHSAAILRRELDAIKKRFPLQKNMVVIGHSMGGCISRLLITDTGDKIWMGIFKKPPAQVPMSPETKQLLTEAVMFQHRPEVGRVIFIAAPLRGSELATNWVGRIGTKLVKSPATLLKAGNEVLKVATFQADDLKLNRMPNSVDTLAPNNRFVREINKIPIAPGIPYHVISGDRGKGGNKDHTKPVMSDGIVPYWSSHLDGAQSELVVPSGHSAHQNPQAIAEVKRILKRHVR